jgi:hypothetical protein
MLKQIVDRDTWFIAHNEDLSVIHYGFCPKGTALDSGQPIIEEFEPNKMIDFVAISEGLIMLLLAVIGWFLNKTMQEVKHAVDLSNQNSSRIELVEQQQRNDVKRIEETTQLEIRQLTQTIEQLSKNVDLLVTSFTNMKK